MNFEQADNGTAESRLERVSTIDVGFLAAKRTKECFTASHWYRRDHELDRWLPPLQSDWTGKVSIYEFRQPEHILFESVATAVLDVAPHTPPQELVALLKARRHTLPLSAPEVLVARQEAGEAIGLRADTWPMYAFVEDRTGDVSILCILHRSRDAGWEDWAGWYALAHGRDEKRLYSKAGARLLLGNMERPTL